MDFITLVPTDPRLVPVAADQGKALPLFRQIAPDADDIRLICHAGVELFDCGSNLDRITCPGCGAAIGFDWWGNTMTEDYVPAHAGEEPRGFRLQAYTLPCCGVQSPLDALQYHAPMAFGRFGLQARNTKLGLLSDAQTDSLARALRCAVRVVYQHL